MDRKKATVQAVLNYGGVAMPLPQTNQAGRIVRFGIFEVDLAAGELRKGGARVRLQEQPFQVLAYLLQHPGEIVTRERAGSEVVAGVYIRRLRSQPEHRSK